MELSGFLEEEGMAVRPFAHPTMTYFQQLSATDKELTLNSLRDYLSVCRLVRNSGQSLKNNAVFVEIALRYFGLTPHPEFKKQLAAGQGVVEFYTLAGHQFFRTFSYFEMTSYTLEDIYCRSWNILYERPEELNRQMFEDIERFVIQADPLAVLTVGSHVIQERLSLERLAVDCKKMQMTLLQKNQQPAAIGVVVDCVPLARARF